MHKDIKELHAVLRENIGSVIVGKEKVVDYLIISLLCGGHVLIEDVPGTGKTMLVKALAASLDCSFKRIQFTPDLLPTDITGINFFNMKKGEFEFIAGPAFSNIILADEINRATPKTQSGLLECMEEHQITIDGKTYALAAPFMVIATQNTVESTGVFPLPEAQLDRFLVKLSMGYPTSEELVTVLQRFESNNPLNTLKPVADGETVLACAQELSRVYIHKDLKTYIAALCEATRVHDSVVLGVSPRGALALMRVAQGMAAINGREYVIPDDIKSAAVPTLAHRLLLKNAARFQPNAAERVITDVASRVCVPTEDTAKWQL